MAGLGLTPRWGIPQPDTDLSVNRVSWIDSHVDWPSSFRTFPAFGEQHILGIPIDFLREIGALENTHGTIASRPWLELRLANQLDANRIAEITNLAARNTWFSLIWRYPTDKKETMMIFCIYSPRVT